jgi:hypothetical protein
MVLKRFGKEERRRKRGTMHRITLANTCERWIARASTSDGTVSFVGVFFPFP